MNLVEFNKTKIIATVGPASNTKKKLKELVNAGTDVFRLNIGMIMPGAMSKVQDEDMCARILWFCIFFLGLDCWSNY